MEPAVIDANVVNGFGNAESEKMVSPGHEPGDDDGTADEPEEVVGGAEDDELEGAHGSGRDGRADDPGLARRERRRGGRPCTSSGIRGGQAGVKRGIVRVLEKSNGCRMWHARYHCATPRRVRAWS